MESYKKGSKISSPRSCQFCGFYSFASSLRDACSFHLVLASQEGRQRPRNLSVVTRCRLELSGRNSAAGWYLWSHIPWVSHRYARMRHSWTHHQLSSRKQTPLLLLSSLQGFKEAAFQVWKTSMQPIIMVGSWALKFSSHRFKWQFHHKQLCDLGQVRRSFYASVSVTVEGGLKLYLLSQYHLNHSEELVR